METKNNYNNGFSFAKREVNENLRVAYLAKEKDTNNIGTCYHTNDKAYCGRH